MIIGIGSDIVKISRIEELISSFQHQFLEKILIDSEIEKAKSISLHKKYISFVAKRFAAKEAFAKALGTGIGKEISFQDLFIDSDEFGKPRINLNSKLKDKLFAKYGNLIFHLSLSDEEQYALAFVIIEKG